MKSSSSDLLEFYFNVLVYISNCISMYLAFFKFIRNDCTCLLQEMMFNALASFLYLSSASYLAFSTKIFLLPEYYLKPGFDVYPAMTAAYVSEHLLPLFFSFNSYLIARENNSSFIYRF